MKFPRGFPLFNLLSSLLFFLIFINSFYCNDWAFKRILFHKHKLAPFFNQFSFVSFQFRVDGWETQALSLQPLNSFVASLSISCREIFSPQMKSAFWEEDPISSATWNSKKGETRKDIITFWGKMPDGALTQLLTQTLYIENSKLPFCHPQKCFSSPAPHSF